MIWFSRLVGLSNKFRFLEHEAVKKGRKKWGKMVELLEISMEEKLQKNKKIEMTSFIRMIRQKLRYSDRITENLRFMWLPQC